MAWPLIAAAAMSVAGGLMKGKGEEAKSKADAETQKELARIAANEERRTLAYRDKLADHYSQLNKQRRRDARASTFGGFSKRTKFKEAEGFERKPLVEDHAPDVPISVGPVVTAATYKKPSLWDRLTKPQLSLDPLGIAGGSTNLRGRQITPGSTTDATVTYERQGG